MSLPSQSTPLRANELAEDAVRRLAGWVREAVPEGLALILTGSTAREEATIAFGPNGARWLSDLELLVVLPTGADRRAEARRLNALAQALRRRLAVQGVQVQVELTPAPERYFSSVRPSLFAYELMTHGRPLYGRTDFLGRIPRFGWRDIPEEDGWRLTSNRIVEWLDFLLSGRERELPDQFYLLSKIYLDLVTSLSLFSGHYAPTYRERIEQVERILDGARAAGCPIPAAPLRAGAAIAADFKFDPQTGFDWLWRSEAFDLETALRQAGRADLFEQLPGLLLAVWRWEASRPACRRAAGGLAVRLRGWARLLLRSEGGRRWALLRRAAVLGRRGSPRSLIYDCAAALVDPGRGRSEETLRRVARRLPAPPESGGWEGLARQTVALWKRHLRRSFA